MKKIFLALLMVLLMASQAWAAWTLTPSKVTSTDHYLVWKVLCTSDGSALSATDLIALLPSNLLSVVQKGCIIDMEVQPGTGGVAPDNAFILTLSETIRGTRYTHAALSNVANTNADPSEDLGQYPDIGVDFLLTFDDIGASGDQITIVFTEWIE